jgi:hypothetical protein
MVVFGIGNAFYQKIIITVGRQQQIGRLNI